MVAQVPGPLLGAACLTLLLAGCGSPGDPAAASSPAATATERPAISSPLLAALPRPKPAAPRRPITLAGSETTAAAPKAKPPGPSPAEIDALAVALEAYNRGDFARALASVRPLADQGLPSAQYRLGLMYLAGQGVPADRLEAVVWLDLATENGVDDAAKASELAALGLTEAERDEAARRVAARRPIR